MRIVQEFYGEVACPENQVYEKRFFQRVFVVGRQGKYAIILPYNNTDDREQFQLLPPFATEVCSFQYYSESFNH